MAPAVVNAEPRLLKNKAAAIISQAKPMLKRTVQMLRHRYKNAMPQAQAQVAQAQHEAASATLAAQAL